MLEKNEIIKIVDGCYYGQAVSFEENQIIKECIEQQNEEIEQLKGRNSRYAQKITELKEKLKYKEILDKNVKSLVNDQAKKVKRLFPLENTPGYGQLCDKVLEYEKIIHTIANIDTVFLNQNGTEREWNDKEALKEIENLVKPIWDEHCENSWVSHRQMANKQRENQND